MTPDANFDDIAGRFEEDIYGSSKGYVRSSVLWEDLSCEAPEILQGGLSILDAGGGAGHIALAMAQFGNDVILCDPSREMLLKAEEAIKEANPPGSVVTLHSSIQNLEVQNLEVSDPGKFDIVTCHAVLEWLDDPRETLGRLVEFLKHNGRLSLMFYNRNATLLKKVLGGELSSALQGYDKGLPSRGWGEGATPLTEKDVRGWLDEFGLRVCSKAGVRIFHDHVPESARNGEQLETLLTLEKKMRREEPFASLGQHIHLACEWNRNTP